MNKPQQKFYLTKRFTNSTMYISDVSSIVVTPTNVKSIEYISIVSHGNVLMKALCYMSYN